LFHVTEAVLAPPWGRKIMGDRGLQRGERITGKTISHMFKYAVADIKPTYDH